VNENNRYGMGTVVERASAVPEIRQKAEGYGIPNARVDGMNLIEVRQAAEEHLEFIRSGNGPFFLEAVTYRFRGHSMGDPERYRQKDEVEKWQEEDPIGIYRRYLLKEKIATGEELEELEDKVEAEVQEAVEFAESSPEPAPEELFTDIYAEN